MKRLLFITGLFILSINFMFGQNAKTEFKTKAGETVKLSIVLKDKVYQLAIDIKTKTYEQTILSSNLTSNILNEFINSSFISYTNQINKAAAIANNNPIPPAITSLSSTLANDLKSNGDLAYMDLIASLNSEKPKGQEIATIKLASIVTIQVEPIKTKNDSIETKNNSDKTDINRDKKKKRISEYKTRTFKPEYCQIVFEDGFIKSIITKGKLDDSTRYFSNSYGIGITTRSDYRRLITYNLFDDQSKNSNAFIPVGALIDYIRNIDEKTNDYSPQNGVITIYPNEPRKLYKAPASDIFTLKIFSDFAGIKQDNPNGLVQTEVSKRVNLWTRKYNFLKTNYLGIGYFTFIKPTFSYSKIEENNRELNLMQGTIDDTIPRYFTSPLQTYRHSISNFKLDFNLFEIEGSAGKFDFNGVLGLNVSRLADSLSGDSLFVQPKEKNINSLMYGLKGIFIFNPESSWSFELSSTSFWMDNLKDGIHFNSETKSGLIPENKLIHVMEALVSWNAGKNSTLFGRIRFNHEWQYFNNNFSQVQVGFAKKLKSSKE